MEQRMMALQLLDDDRPGFLRSVAHRRVDRHLEGVLLVAPVASVHQLLADHGARLISHEVLHNME